MFPNYALEFIKINRFEARPFFKPLRIVKEDKVVFMGMPWVLGEAVLWRKTSSHSLSVKTILLCFFLPSLAHNLAVSVFSGCPGTHSIVSIKDQRHRIAVRGSHSLPDARLIGLICKASEW
jgi:hypothetical protein